MRNRLPTLASALSLIVAVALSGCGGEGGEEEAGGDGALTRAAYIAEGDRICADGTARMARQAIERFGGEQPSGEEARDFGSEVVVPTLEEQLAQLRALPAPAGDRESVGAIYDAVDSGIEELRADPGLLTRPNNGGAFDQANRLARRFGFRQCGSA